MGVFRAFFGCSGAGGFMLACISGCRGVIGFKVGTWPCPVREKVRPARPGVDVSAKKFAQRTKNGSKSALCGVLGELFREYTAGWVTLGELFRAGCGKGRHSDGFFVEKSRILSRNDDLHNAGRSQAPRPGPGQPRLQRPKRSARPRVMRGGRQHSECSEGKQYKRHYGRKQRKRRTLTSSRASRGTRWSRAAGSRRAGTGGLRPRARGAR